MANGQSRTGNKTDLIERVADGKQFGRIPTCSSCGGGKPRFDRDIGKYKCPGYMEDTDFVFCKKTTDFYDLKRTDWL